MKQAIFNNNRRFATALYEYTLSSGEIAILDMDLDKKIFSRRIALSFFDQDMILVIDEDAVHQAY